MLKTLVACAIACGLSLPAVAGERSGVSLRPTAVQRFTLPVGKARIARVPAETLTAQTGQTRSTSVGAASWGPGSTLPEVTARSGGSYAVHDILRDQPRPRFRRSPLSAAFVLKLDGNDESPAFSVGGGGVAAAVWQAVPK
jgi:hypothetical protein